MGTLKFESQTRMTTLFEESDNTNPPSPSLGLLDASSLKSELDAQRKAVTNSSAETEEDLSSGNFMQFKCIVLFFMKSGVYCNQILFLVLKLRVHLFTLKLQIKQTGFCM